MDLIQGRNLKSQIIIFFNPLQMFLNRREQLVFEGKVNWAKQSSSTICPENDWTWMACWIRGYQGGGGLWSSLNHINISRSGKSIKIKVKHLIPLN